MTAKPTKVWQRPGKMYAHLHAVKARFFGGGIAGMGVNTPASELRDASAQVTPTGDAVAFRQADNLTVEHARHPKLARDERRETETDAQTADEEPFERSPWL